MARHHRIGERDPQGCESGQRDHRSGDGGDLEAGGNRVGYGGSTPGRELATRDLELAYQTRSQKSHVLRDLPPEVSCFRHRDIRPHRRVRHHADPSGYAALGSPCNPHIRGDGPKGVDTTFDWRRALPGRATLRLAPQYWIADAVGFSNENALDRLAGLAELFVETIANRGEGVPKLTDVLGRIEDLVPGLAKSDKRTAMIAIYWMWHRLMATEEHRPGGPQFLEVLSQPGSSFDHHVSGQQCIWHRPSKVDNR